MRKRYPKDSSRQKPAEFLKLFQTKDFITEDEVEIKNEGLVSSQFDSQKMINLYK